MEEWKSIPGYEGLYEVSSLGQVRSLDREVGGSGGRTQSIKGRTLTPQNKKGGYLGVVLCRDGKLWNARINRLVLMAFVGECPPKMEACHGNGDPTDNRLENLRWDTRQNNILDTVTYGTHVHARKTECDAGHPLEGKNLYVNPVTDQRVCRICQRGYMRSYMRDRRAAEKAARTVDSE